MNTFTRSRFSHEEMAAKALKQEIPHRVDACADYAPYTSIQTDVKSVDAATALAGMDKVLGKRLTSMFLDANAEASVHVAAETISHLRRAKAVDVQSTLIVNVVKEIAGIATDDQAERQSLCGDLLRRCSFEPDYKKKINIVLTHEHALDSPLLVEVPDEA